MGYKETVMSWDEATKTRDLTSEDIFHCEQTATIGLVEDDEDAQEVYEGHYKMMVELMQRYKAAEAQAKLTWPIAEKAGIKKIFEWGNQPCPHQFYANTKQQCRACWDELRDQAFLEVEK